MANNVVLRDNLAADAVVDDDSETIWFVSVIHGAGAPVGAPPVADKDWIYVNTTSTPKAGYLWNAAAAAWQAFGATGTPTAGWALDGNTADGDDILGTTNNQDLRIVVNGDQVMVAESTDGSVRVQPGGVSSLLTSGPTQQLFVGPTHPQTGFGPTLMAGDEDDKATNPVRFVRLGADGVPSTAEVGVEGGALLSILSAVTGAGDASFGVSSYEGATTGADILGHSSDGLAIRSRSGSFISRQEHEVGTGGDEIVWRVQVLDPASPLAGQTLELTLGGLRLEEAVTESDGLTEVGGGSNLTADLVARHKTATALYPAGMYLEAVQRTIEVELIVQIPQIEVVTGDGLMFFTVPDKLNNWLIDDVNIATPGTAASSGTTTVQIARVRAGTPVDVLSTKATIDATEFSSYTAAVGAVVDTANDDVVAGDFLRVDVDVAGVDAAGLQVIIKFRAP